MGGVTLKSRLLNAMGYGVAGLLVAMLCVEIGNILGRPCGFPIHGSVELTSYLGALLTSVCVFFATATDTNVAVQLLSSRVTGRLKAVMKLFTSLVGLGTFGLLAWTTLVYASRASAEGERSVLLDLNLCGIRYVLLACLILAGCILAGKVYRACGEVRKKS